MTTTPSSPLTLPCSTVLKNRLMKSAMSEAMGTKEGAPRPELCTLYRRWANGGVGLSVTGNVMVDRYALGEPGNVFIEDDRHLEALNAWAAAGSEHGTALWMQINHPGKQVPRGLNRESVSPSAIPFAPSLRNFFATPRELTEEEIRDIIRRFGVVAGVAKQAGFGGVQIHGAHGYLVSQFLSPHHNQRKDAWGGSLDNRMRFVLEVYARMRDAVGARFPVGIKLNSADFQRGGFTEDESLQVIDRLGQVGIDLIEISGGTYEAPAMATGNIKESTRKREAYFLDFAKKARAITRTPLSVTGGFRSRAGIEGALAEGALDMVGIARPTVLDPDFPKRILAGEDVTSVVKPIRTGIGLVDRTAMLEVTWYTRQLQRMGNGHEPNPNASPTMTLVSNIMRQGFGSVRNRMRA